MTAIKRIFRLLGLRQAGLGCWLAEGEASGEAESSPLSSVWEKTCGSRRSSCGAGSDSTGGHLGSSGDDSGSTVSQLIGAMGKMRRPLGGVGGFSGFGAAGGVKWGMGGVGCWAVLACRSGRKNSKSHQELFAGLAKSRWRTLISPVNFRFARGKTPSTLAIWEASRWDFVSQYTSGSSGTHCITPLSLVTHLCLPEQAK